MKHNEKIKSLTICLALLGACGGSDAGVAADTGDAEDTSVPSDVHDTDAAIGDVLDQDTVGDTAGHDSMTSDTDGHDTTTGDTSAHDTTGPDAEQRVFRLRAQLVSAAVRSAPDAGAHLLESSVGHDRPTGPAVGDGGVSAWFGFFTLRLSEP